VPYLSRLLPYPQTLRLGLKSLPGTSTSLLRKFVNIKTFSQILQLSEIIFLMDFKMTLNSFMNTLQVCKILDYIEQSQVKTSTDL
jgi:hypothetical protein